MDVLKEVFSKLNFHLNAPNKELKIIYGVSTLTIRVTPDGKVNVSTDLFLESPE